MSNTYSELVDSINAGNNLGVEQVHDLLLAEDGQDFALIEAASILRRNEFRNMIAIEAPKELADAMSTRAISTANYDQLDISHDIDSQELAEQLVALRESKAVGFSVKLPENAIPMSLLRILAIARLAAPQKVIHLPEGFEDALRSLTSLSLHVVSAITISDDLDRWETVNDLLKSMRHGGIVIAGSGSANPLAGYLNYLASQGVDLMGIGGARGSSCGSADGGGCCGGHDEAPAASSGGCGCGGGGCGGHAEPEPEPVVEGCGCGSGGCGSYNAEPEPEPEPEPLVEGCGCGSGGCGSYNG